MIVPVTLVTPLIVERAGQEVAPGVARLSGVAVVRSRGGVAMGVGRAEVVADLVSDDEGVADEVGHLEELAEAVVVGVPQTEPASQAMPEA